MRHVALRGCGGCVVRWLGGQRRFPHPATGRGALPGGREAPQSEQGADHGLPALRPLPAGFASEISFGVLFLWASRIPSIVFAFWVVSVFGFSNFIWALAMQLRQAVFGAGVAMLVSDLCVALPLASLLSHTMRWLLSPLRDWDGVLPVENAFVIDKPAYWQAPACFPREAAPHRVGWISIA